MPTIICTSRLQHVGPSTAETFSGSTVLEVIARVADKYPLLPGYLLDDQGSVRQHVAIFVDGQSIPRQRVLLHKVNPDTEIYLMQALSGG